VALVTAEGWKLCERAPERLTKFVTRPVRTFDTAVIYYHKFRLVHSDGEYAFAVCDILSYSQVSRLLMFESRMPQQQLSSQHARSKIPSRSPEISYVHRIISRCLGRII
jgi:hypothetical protein